MVPNLQEDSHGPPNQRPACVADRLAIVVVCAFALPAVAQSTGMVKGKVIDDKGQPVDGAKVTIEHDRRHRPAVRDEDRQEGRVHPDRPAVGSVQDHRRKGQARRRDRQHARQPAWRRRACGSSSAAAPATSAPWPPRRAELQQDVRRRRRAEPRRQARRGDREVQQGAGGSTRTATTATTTSATLRPEEGLEKAEETYKKSIA